MTARAAHPSPQSGQTLPLAAISLLVLALVVFLSLNIAYTVRNRIRLQNYADAKAYSAAVQEARTFNYFAYTNRAIANAYVDMATLHAYMSTTAMMSTVYSAMAVGFAKIVGDEQNAADAAYSAWDIGEGLEHEWHAIEAGINAVDYGINYASGTMGGRLQKLDQPFGKTMDALGLEIDALWKSEKELKKAMQLGFLLADSTIGLVRDNNMKDPSQGSGVPVTDRAVGLGALNARAYANAIDDSASDTKRIEMTNVVNATRPPFTWDRNSSVGAAFSAEEILQPMFSKIKQDAPMDSDAFTSMFVTQSPNIGYEGGGRTGMSDGHIDWFGSIGPDVDPSVVGNGIDSWDWCLFNFTWHEGAVLLVPLPTLIIPAPLGVGELDTSNTSDVHSGDEAFGDDFDWFNSPHDSTDHAKDLAPHRFMEFKITDAAPFNQPVVYSYVSADLRIGDNNVARPWEVNSTGTVKVDVGGGAQGQGEVHLANDRGRGRAVSKAMVYYHRFGDWREPPNFFNPYWRAKMESFDGIGELDKVMAAGEATDSPDVNGILAVDALKVLGSGALNLKK